jgi:hypothetical protein
MTEYPMIKLPSPNEVYFAKVEELCRRAVELRRDLLVGEPTLCGEFKNELTFRYIFLPRGEPYLPPGQGCWTLYRLPEDPK